MMFNHIYIYIYICRKPKFKGVISEEKAEAKSQGKKEPSYVEKKVDLILFAVALYVAYNNDDSHFLFLFLTLDVFFSYSM